MDTIDLIVRVLTWQGYYYSSDSEETIKEIDYWIEKKKSKHIEYLHTPDSFNEIMDRVNKEIVQEILSNSASWLG